ncbi:MAG: sigma-70 family RNA polymerase sigma factor [Acidobacteriota bacterium]|nr:sigma-70 family RNA polymerase sigma factor [Acidobacteriota bacterium]
MPEVRHKNHQIEQAIVELQSGIDGERNFRLVFDFYYRPIHGFFRRKTFSAPEADDLTQETFLRVYHKIEQFRGGDAPFEAWLWQIANNLFRKSITRQHTLKRTGATISLDDDESDVADVYLADKSGATPLDEILRAEQRQELQTAIEDLPEQMRKCIKLRVFQDLSYREIAVVMRLSTQTVKTHLFQARKHLRERLGAYFENVQM